jgi:hypothetical protein
MKNVKYKSVQPVNVSKYPARTMQERKLIAKNPYGDRDRDKVPNYMDCKPMNKKKQNFGGLLGGLLGLAIVANVAGNIMNKSNQNRRKY